MHYDALPKLTHYSVWPLQRCILQCTITSDRERRVLTFMYLMNIWCERKTGERQERNKTRERDQWGQIQATSKSGICSQFGSLRQTHCWYMLDHCSNSLQARYTKKGVSNEQWQRKYKWDKETDRKTDRQAQDRRKTSEQDTTLFSCLNQSGNQSR